MQAMQFAEYGGPEVLRLVEVDEPHAGAGQVRIAVRAAGVNGSIGRFGLDIWAVGRHPPSLRGPGGCGWRGRRSW